PKPSRPSMKLIRPREEARERGDARRVGGLHPKRWALADMPGQALDLILARLDDAAQQVVAVGKSAQLGKAGRLVIARRDREVEAEGIVELPAGILRRRGGRQRRLRPEPARSLAARDGIAEPARQPRDEAFLHRLLRNGESGESGLRRRGRFGGSNREARSGARPSARSA